LLVTGPILCRAIDAPQFSDLVAANPKLNRWLVVQMPEDFQGSPPKTYKASAFSTSQLLWQDGTEALYYATARPPTYATPDEVGVLIAARRGVDGNWRVMKSIRFEARGLEGGTKAELTSFDPLGPGTPVVTVTLVQGGRGYSFSESFTYTMKDDNFILHQPGGRNFF
jgi:hypothetical protein